MAKNPYFFSSHSDSIFSNELQQQNLILSISTGLYIFSNIYNKQFSSFSIEIAAKSFSKVYQQKIYLLSAMVENPYLFSNHSDSICCNELLKQNLCSLAIESNISLNNVHKTKFVFFNSDSRKLFLNCFISNNIFLAIIAVNSHFFSSYSDNICCNEL